MAEDQTNDNRVFDAIQGLASRAKNSYGYTLALSIATTAAAHPLTYVKVLIQVGHEPLAPQPVTTFFGQRRLRLPNLFQYAGHIKRTDGWFGLYRGVGPRIVHNIISSSVTNAINNKMKENENGANKTADGKSVKEFLRETGNVAVTKTAALVLSYPFHVISVRMMVEFVGRENYYGNIFSSIKEIYQEEGILGFFSGFIPYLIGELFALWVYRSFTYLTLNYIVSNEHSQLSEVRNYSQGIAQYVASIVTYPFYLVTNNMAVNDTRLAAGLPPLMPIYSSWTECWVELGKKGLRKRGSTLFRRDL